MTPILLCSFLIEWILGQILKKRGGNKRKTRLLTMQNLRLRQGQTTEYFTIRRKTRVSNGFLCFINLVLSLKLFICSAFLAEFLLFRKSLGGFRMMGPVASSRTSSSLSLIRKLNSRGRFNLYTEIFRRPLFSQWSWSKYLVIKIWITQPKKIVGMIVENSEFY